MSFRGRLRLFFALIVVVPMFALTGRTETGKADAGLAAGTRAAVGIYREELEDARPALRRLAGDEGLHRALASGRTAAAERRLRELDRGHVAGAELWSRGARRARTGSRSAVAFAGSELVVRGSTVVLTVSTSDAPAFAKRVNALTGL